jgi:threonine synthase
MGLPVKRFIAANNRNDIFLNYLQTGIYEPKPSIATIANAMDVGDPSNFARIIDLYEGSHKTICGDVSGCRYSDEQIREGVKSCYAKTKYLLDPHGACGYLALKEGLLTPPETGLFLETAHPAKFKETIESIIQQPIAIPERLQYFMKKEKQNVSLSNQYNDLKFYLEQR